MISLLLLLFQICANDTALAAPVPLEFVRQKLSELTGATTVNINGVKQLITERSSDAGKNLARAFLKQEYEKLGYTVREQTYSSTFNKGTNLIAERPGAENGKILIFGAHYDTAGNIPGADDNGSGTIALLGVASSLQNLRSDITLRFVSFDQEELGLFGSQAYVKKIKQAGDLPRIIGTFIFDTAGYDKNNDGRIHSIHCASDWNKPENTSGELTALLSRMIEKNRIPLVITPACTTRSDHASFWREKQPAIIISANYFGNAQTPAEPNPCYHKSCDKIDSVNLPFLARIILAASLSAAELLLH